MTSHVRSEALNLKKEKKQNKKERYGLQPRPQWRGQNARMLHILSRLTSFLSSEQKINK